MAVKVCTKSGRCITCQTDSNARQTWNDIEASEKAGNGSWCCFKDKAAEKLACFRISEIETVEDVALGEDGEEEGEEGRPEEPEDQDVPI